MARSLLLPFAAGCTAALLTLPAGGQPSRERPGPRDEPIMTVDEYEPHSTLVVPQNPVPRAKFPFVDVHSHQWRPTPEDVDQLIRDMDAMNMAVMVNLSGGSGEGLQQMVEVMKGRYPNRFVVFANISFEGIDESGYGERTAAQLEADVKNGAQGLKIYKNLGMTATDAAGQSIPTDDPRLDPVWAKCGELGIPVLIHTAEPASFFEPHDLHNERWLELKLFPNRARPPERFPPWETLMAEQWNLFRKHPKTTFISAHFGWLAGDLDRLGKILDELPNMYVEMGAILAELGRQPRHFRHWLERYGDRVLFGKDSWRPEEYPYYFRTLETADEYFDYYRKRHAHWKLYGANLPDPLLRKIYYENALQVIPGLDRSLFPGTP
jgi:predicted TIM-barrel fold metal-dependent hydrolase